MGVYAELFRFAAKAGSLEGYLYERAEVAPLENWVSNIIRMYGELPEDTRSDIASDLAIVIERILKYGERTLAPELKSKLAGLLAEIKK